MNRARHLRNVRRARKARSVRRKVRGTPERPRLTVHRSHKQMYAQVVDDLHGVTLASVSSLEAELKAKLAAPKAANARALGEELARRLIAKGVDAVVFDRGWYPFHGRVKALAEGARAGGLKF